MFSGIIEATGSVVGLRRHDDDLSIDVDTGDMQVDDVAIGDSIAVSGPCLTVTKIRQKGAPLVSTSRRIAG